jgi:hypothetical protein
MTASVRPNIKRDLPHGRERPWFDVGKCGVTIYEYELTFVIFAVEGNSAIAPAASSLDLTPLSGDRLETAGRRHLGGPRPHHSLRSFEGHGLGCIRSRGT